jgi:hypothetical protein
MVVLLIINLVKHGEFSLINLWKTALYYTETVRTLNTFHTV